MPAPKRTPAPKKASGRNVEEWERRTERIVLRLRPEIATRLRSRAAADEVTLSDYVARLVETDDLAIE